MNTKTIRTAVEHMAVLLDWEVDTSGRAWGLGPIPETLAGEDTDREISVMSWSPAEILATFLRVAMAPERYRGLGMEPAEVRTYLNKVLKREPTATPRGTSAYDERTFARVWPQLKGSGE